ncbi:MAG: T9SS type A sorting domain-containing protein [Saprospiraceae bacterium]|nr:T9SS type A sorting domain-containing protein [Saprospiraceae bacterium]
MLAHQDHERRLYRYPCNCGLVSSTEEVPQTALGKVKIYPNPANEVVHIQVPGNSGKASMEINVFDLSGQQRKVILLIQKGI